MDASEIKVNAGRDVLIKSGTRHYTGAKIGHGHTQQNLTSFVENKITADAGRNVELVSPQFATLTGVSYSGTQIGHGGVTAAVDGGDSGYSGDVVVNAGGKLDLIAAKNATTFNYALVGHTAYYNTRGNHSGAITVTTGTEAGLTDYGITLVAGKRTDAASASNSYYSFAAIGHRGHSNGAGGGDLSGNIKVEAERGGLSLTGGENAGTADVRLHAAQIGHGGYNSDGLKSGTITVCIEDDIELVNDDARDSPVQIGHGGFSHNDTISDSIQVTSKSGSILLDSTTGDRIRSNTQIGHGGPSAGGTMDGAISVSALQDITIKGGSVDATHAMIGHGGDGTNGDFSGDIGVLAGGNLTVTGGTHADGFAMVGHGSARPNTSGTRSGAVRIGVGAATTLTDNTGLARLGHGTTTAGGVSNSEFVLATGALDTTNNALGVSGITDVMIEGGDVSFAVLGGDLNVDGAGAFYDSANVANFVASGNVNVLSSIQNAGTGGVNVAGGWSSLVGFNPATNEFDGTNGLTLDIDFNNCLKLETLDFDFAPIKADLNLWGATGSTVTVGNPAQAAAIGSRGGTTNVLADIVTLQAGSNTGDHAQIGFIPTADGQTADGMIMVSLKDGDLTVNGGDQADAYAQIGHGGTGAVGSSDLTGAIMVDMDANGDGNIGDLSMAGGTGDGAYSQVGHGGNGHVGTKSADIDITAAAVTMSGGGNDAYAQIGNGGNGGRGDITGGVAVTTTTGSVSLTGGTGTSSVAQIGTGGRGYAGISSGNNVAVTSATGVTLQLGPGDGSRALIGSGGEGASGEFSGDVTVTANAGDVDLLATGTGLGASAQIGNSVVGSFATLAGDVAVEASGSVNVVGGTSNFSFAQIGNGGLSGSGDFSGLITVDAGEAVNVVAPRRTLSWAYAKIGHGDDLPLALPLGTGTREGDIQVGAGGDIVLLDGMIGHVNDVAVSVTATGGNTYVAPSRDDPTATGGGRLVTTSGSELTSAPSGELRFYLPTRANNQMASGTLLNGTPYIGTSPDPSEDQRADEFVRNILGDNPSAPNEHENLDPFYEDNLTLLGPGGPLTNGTGNYSTALGNYSLYYDTITLTDPPEEIPPVVEPPAPEVPEVPVPEEPGPDVTPEENVPVLVEVEDPFNPNRLFPDDWYLDDWHWEHAGLVTGFRSFGIYYEGYDHYGHEGESIFHYYFGNRLDSGLGSEVDLDGFEVLEGGGASGESDEDVLKRHRRQLKETSEDVEETEEEN